MQGDEWNLFRRRLQPEYISALLYNSHGFITWSKRERAHACTHTWLLLLSLPFPPALISYFTRACAGYTQRKERRGMRAFGSPLCHRGPTYRMCHLQRMSFCPPPSSPPPLSVFYSQLRCRWDATPHGRWSERAEMHTQLSTIPEVLSMVNIALSISAVAFSDFIIIIYFFLHFRPLLSQEKWPAIFPF